MTQSAAAPPRRGRPQPRRDVHVAPSAGCPDLPGHAFRDDVQPDVYAHLADAVTSIGAAHARAGRGAAPRRRLMTLTIGVDVGGTKVAGGVVDEKGVILARTGSTPRRATPRRPTTPSRAVADDASRARRRGGRYRHRRASSTAARSEGLFRAPTCAGWRDGRCARGRERVGLPVVVENDANAAAWGEYDFGAGRDDRFIVCVTVGTGIGGGMIVDRMLYRGGFGVGGEIGHIQMVEDGRQCCDSRCGTGAKARGSCEVPNVGL